jgi:hypothetical protein
MAERKTDKLTEAAEKTTAVLQGLQSRLSREAGGMRSARPEIPDDLGRQLEEYFAAAPVQGEASLPSAAGQAPPVHASHPAGLDEIRSRVIEGVAERILRTWQQPGGRLSAAFKDALVERLMARVIELLESQNTKPGSV